MKVYIYIYIYGSCGGGNGLCSSELALHKISNDDHLKVKSVVVCALLASKGFLGVMFHNKPRKM